MMYMVEDDTHHYRCYDGRCLDHIRTEQSRQEGLRRLWTQSPVSVQI